MQPPRRYLLRFIPSPIEERIRQRYKKRMLLRGLLTITLLAASLLAVSGILDNTGHEYTDSAFKRALITFGIAKALNGVISVAQGTEVAIQPAGIGMNFTPGQILDPLNDLVEQFSWIMLASSVSLGMQKTLLHIGSGNWLNLLLLGTTLACVLLIWWKHKSLQWWRKLLFKLALTLLILRIAVPVFALINELVYHQFLQNEYQVATTQLEQTTTSISTLNETSKQSLEPVESKSVWEAAKQLYHSTSDMLNVEKRLDQYKQAAADTTEQAIRLIVIFIFQTVLMPILFLVAVYYLIKACWRYAEQLLL